MGKLRKITGYAATTIGVGLLLAIFAMSLPLGGWRALSVQTGSMAPAIRPGALVLVHRVPESDLHVGDVITYASKDSPGMTLTHRIVELKTTGASKQIIVKGDANNVADAPVAPSQVVGKVAKSVPVLGKVSDFAHKPLGLALLVYLPALLIVVYELRLLVRRLTAVEIDKQKAAMQAEHDKKPLSLPDDENISEAVVPGAAIKQPRRVRSLDGLRLIVVLALASFFVHTTHAALNSQATLTGTTISSAPISHPTPPPPTTTSCSNTNSVNVTNTSTQTATTGSTTSSTSTSGSTATSGDASNVNSANTSVVITNGC